MGTRSPAAPTGPKQQQELLADTSCSLRFAEAKPHSSHSDRSLKGCTKQYREEDTHPPERLLLCKASWENATSEQKS